MAGTEERNRRQPQEFSGVITGEDHMVSRPVAKPQLTPDNVYKDSYLASLRRAEARKDKRKTSNTKKNSTPVSAREKETLRIAQQFVERVNSGEIVLFVSTESER